MNNKFYALLLLAVLFCSINSELSAQNSNMKWVLLQELETRNNCVSESNCNQKTVCYGLEYTPNMTGTITSYTTGFLVDCLNGNNPVLSNLSCEMSNNSREIEDCNGSGLILMNSSGNTGTSAVTQNVPILLHQVCFDFSTDQPLEILEEEMTNLTVSLDLGSSPKDELPNYNTYQVAGSDCQILPVEWLSFKAKQVNESSALLEWATATETNASHYEVEHATNVKDFKPISKVKAAGNSLSTQHYEFFHLDVQQGINYYRIKQIDLDGTYEYTPVEAVIFDSKKKLGLSIFPNPTNGWVNILIQTEASYTTLKISDARGKTIREFTTDTQDTFYFDASTLAAGMYQVEVQTNKGERYIEKLVITEK
ncbi:MAG: T9SS type A sorting domain-containing protein [Bacteroidota bacterium]